MRKLINILGLVFLAALAGYSAYWYVLANQAEEQFKNHLAQWQKDGHFEKLTYDSISKEGFPNSINIRLDNVKFAVKEDPRQSAEGELGTLILSLPLWTNQRIVEVQGANQVQFMMKEAPTERVKLNWKGNMTLVGEDPSSATHLDLLKSFFKASQGPSEKKHEIEFVSWKSQVESLEINGSKNGDNQWKLMSGPGSCEVKKRNYKPNQQEIVFSGQHKDLLWNIQQDSAAVDWISKFNISSFNEWGKTSLTAEGSICYPHPSTWDAIAANPLQPRQAEVCLRINKLSLDSDLIHSFLQNTIFSLQQDPTKWTLTLKGYSEGEYTDKYDEVLKNQVARIVKDPEFSKQFVGDDAEAQARLVAHQEDIVSLVPSLHTLGKLISKLDFVASAQLEGPSSLKEANLDLNPLEYFVSPYTINLTAKGAIKENYTDPYLKATLKVTRYKQLLDQLDRYAKRVLEVYRKISATDAPPNSLPFEKAEDVKKLVAFLKDVSDDPKKEGSDLRVTLNYNEANQWKVGTLTLDEFINRVMSFYQALMVTPLPSEAPAATPTVPDVIAPLSSEPEQSSVPAPSEVEEPKLEETPQSTEELNNDESQPVTSSQEEPVVPEPSTTTESKEEF